MAQVIGDTMMRRIPMDYEPRRVNRFFLEFPADVNIEVWKVQNCDRPKMNIAKVEIPYMNEMNYVAGRYTWEEMSMELLDPIGPSTSQQLMEWVRLCAESITSREGYASGYKKTLTLRELDPTGVDVGKWTLQDCQITKVDFGKNDYADDGLSKVSVTFQPYKCILNM